MLHQVGPFVQHATRPFFVAPLSLRAPSAERNSARWFVLSLRAVPFSGSRMEQPALGPPSPAAPGYLGRGSGTICPVTQGLPTPAGAKNASTGGPGRAWARLFRAFGAR